MPGRVWTLARTCTGGYGEYGPLLQETVYSPGLALCCRPQTDASGGMKEHNGKNAMPGLGQPLDQSSDQSSDQSVLEKVTAFITRSAGEAQELLVFQHSSAGIQIPAGTVKKGEDVEAALWREVWEETGLTDLMLLTKLGAETVARPPRQARAPANGPDAFGTGCRSDHSGHDAPARPLGQRDGGGTRRLVTSALRGVRDAERVSGRFGRGDRVGPLRCPDRARRAALLSPRSARADAGPLDLSEQSRLRVRTFLDAA